MDTINVTKETSDGPAGKQAVTTCSMDFYCALTSECVGCSADGATRCDHVVDDCHRFPSDVQILGFVNDGVCIDACFFQIRKLAADLLSNV